MEDKERYCQAVKKDNERAPKVKKIVKELWLASHFPSKLLMFYINEFMYISLAKKLNLHLYPWFLWSTSSCIFLFPVAISSGFCLQR